MRTKRIQVASLLILTTLFPLAGCTTAAKQVLYEYCGARAKVHLVNELGEHELMPYQSVHFESSTSTVTPHICTFSLLRKYDDSCQTMEHDLRDEYPGGEPALRVSSEINYFQRKGLLGSAMCLTRVKMRDGERLVVDAVVLAVSNAFRAGGETALAEASAKAIGKFLKKQKIVEEDEEDEEEKDRD